MRMLIFSILAGASAAIASAAWSQEEAPSSVEDYVCAFSGECPDGEAAEAAADAPAGDRPRVSATRGFALSPPDGAARTPRRPAATQRRTGPTARQRTSPQPRAAAAQPAGPGRRVNLRLSFETGSAKLTAAAHAQAEIFAQSLLRPQLRNMRFLIEGHTDSVGTRASNLDLSQRRAQTVADFLIGAGVGRERLVVRGYGPDRPLPGAPASASENRRVEAVRIS